VAALEFRVLGALEVWRDGELVSVSAPKQRALLSLLLLRANEPVAQDELIDRLWDGDVPRTARASLQNQIHALRKLLGSEALERQPAGYVLHVEPRKLDLRRFEQLVAQARRAEAKERAAKFGEALALWRGPAFAELSGRPFVQPEITRLEEERLAALEERIDADFELGRDVGLVPELGSLVDRHPLRERLWGQLMLALYRAGRQADALAAYRRAHRTFVEELGIEPGVVLRELQRAILVQDEALDNAEPRLGSTLERAAAILPRQGRERAESLYEYGVALSRLGERRQAIPTLRAAERQAAAAGEQGLEERSRLILSHLAIFTEGRSALEHLAAAERAISAFEELGDEAGIALASWHRAHMLRGCGRVGEAAKVAQRGIELAAGGGDPWQEASLRRMLALSLAYGPAPVDHAIPLCEEQLAEEIWGEDGPYGVLGALALLHAQAGRIPEARELSDRELAATQSAGLVAAFVNGTAVAGAVERTAGNLENAAARLRSAHAILEVENDRAFLPEVAGELACVLALQGELVEARRLAESARATVVPNDLVTDALWRRALALVAAHDGRVAEALRLSDEARTRADASDRLSFRGETLEEAAVVRRLADDAPGVDDALREALAVYERKGNIVGAERVRQTLGERGQTPRV
jgi:DNA-binding SARP family transcriptional activator